MADHRNIHAFLHWHSHWTSLYSYSKPSVNCLYSYATFCTCYIVQGRSNMTGTNCGLFTHKSSRSYLNHLVLYAFSLDWSRISALLINKKHNVRITWHRSAFVKSFLPQRSNKYYIFVSVSGREFVRVSACSLAYPAWISYAPCCDVICGPSGSTTYFDIISQTERSSKKKVIEHKMCVLIFFTILFKIFSF